MAKTPGKFAKRSWKVRQRRRSHVLTIHAVSALSGEPICTIQVHSDATNSKIQQRIAKEMGLGEDGISLVLQGEPLGECPLYDQVRLGVVRRGGPAGIMKLRSQESLSFNIAMHPSENGLVVSAENLKCYLEKDNVFQDLGTEELQRPGFYGNHMSLRSNEMSHEMSIFLWSRRRILQSAAISQSRK